jgi:hypothetical protein
MQAVAVKLTRRVSLAAADLQGKPHLNNIVESVATTNAL